MPQGWCKASKNANGLRSEGYATLVGQFGYTEKAPFALHMSGQPAAVGFTAINRVTSSISKPVSAIDESRAGINPYWIINAWWYLLAHVAPSALTASP